MLRRGSAEVTAESALRGARASAELEGAGIELERLRGQLHRRRHRHAAAARTSAGARLVEGAVRLHADLGQVLVAWRHSPRQALARLHVLAAADLVDDPDALGRPRAAGRRTTTRSGSARRRTRSRCRPGSTGWPGC